jgi:hypothetical protein
MHALECTTLVKALMNGQKCLVDSYEIQRKQASQVVVVLLADLDRMWKQKEPHTVPIMYFFRGYSLSMDITNKKSLRNVEKLAQKKA